MDCWIITDLKITTYVAEKYSAYLKPNLPAYVSISSNPEKFEATTFKISPVVNKTNRTILVELKFDKYNKIFKPGMFATVDLVIQEEKNTFVIPKKAIKEEKLFMEGTSRDTPLPYLNILEEKNQSAISKKTLKNVSTLKGKSKKEAEQKVAKKALDFLKKEQI